MCALLGPRGLRPGPLAARRLSSRISASTSRFNSLKTGEVVTSRARGQYIFLVDINGHREEAHVAQALERLRERTGMLKVFGSYPRWQP